MHHNFKLLSLRLDQMMMSILFAIILTMASILCGKTVSFTIHAMRCRTQFDSSSFVRMVNGANGPDQDSSSSSSSSREHPPKGALTGSSADFLIPSGHDLASRVRHFFHWQDLRRSHNLWPYSRSTQVAPTSVCTVRDDSGRSIRGVNFASQDYLGLSSHAAIKKAAKRTVEECGVHSAGSVALLGNTRYSIELEQSISDFVAMNHTLLYPTGWAAGYGAIRGLLRAEDHVVLDALSHNCLQEGARASGCKIHVHRHLDLQSVRNLLARIRKSDRNNGILVVTESLFSMDSDTPDMVTMQELCHEFNATLLVDVAHDLGNLGSCGTGHLGIQDMLGKVDMIMGSFSKTFASNGGFLSSNSREMMEYLKYYSSSCTFSNALSPVQAATVLQAIEIVRSEEGKELRKSLLENEQYLRSKLERTGLKVLGAPSAIVAVKVGEEAYAPLVSEKIATLGAIVNLIEYPAVSKGSARFRLQVMASHSKSNIDDFVARLECALKEARDSYDAYSKRYNE